MNTPPTTNPTPTSEQELRQFYLLASLNDAQLALMKQHSRRIQLKDGEFLFEQSQPAERFFVVVKGRIKLTRFSMDGNEKVIEIVPPHQTFAEAIMFMPKQIYPVNAQAVGATELISFDNKVFLGILEQSFETCKRVMSDMSMRLHQWVNEIDHLTLQNATYRLVNYLLYETPKNHQPGQPYEVHFEVPKHLIASRLSIKPETLSRILHQLIEEKLITVTGRTIQVHHPEKLRRYGQIWG